MLQVPESLSEEIQLCNTQLNYKEGELLKILCKLARVMSNEKFIDQMLEINDDICRLCIWQWDKDGRQDNMADQAKMADIQQPSQNPNTTA